MSLDDEFEAAGRLRPQPGISDSLALDVAQARIRELESQLSAALRWKSTHAPRIEALEGLLAAAQHEAAQGREAVATLESERAANAALTDELATARNEAAEAKGLNASVDKLINDVIQLLSMRGDWGKAVEMLLNRPRCDQHVSALEDAFMQGAAKGAELERNACADGVRRMRNNVGEVSMRASIITETCDFIEQGIRSRNGMEG